MMNIGLGQIILIIIGIIIVFGTGRLPKLMEDLAKGMKAFKKGLSEDEGYTTQHFDSYHLENQSKLLRSPKTATTQKIAKMRRLDNNSQSTSKTSALHSKTKLAPSLKIKAKSIQSPVKKLTKKDVL